MGSLFGADVKVCCQSLCQCQITIISVTFKEQHRCSMVQLKTADINEWFTSSIKGMFTEFHLILALGTVSEDQNISLGAHQHRNLSLHASQRHTFISCESSTAQRDGAEWVVTSRGRRETRRSSSWYARCAAMCTTCSSVSDIVGPVATT